jgi:hypothetical protein
MYRLANMFRPSVAALVDGPGGQALAKLESDPRYLIGRLQQALTTLLATDLPPMDPRTALLSQALGDALAWRTHDGRPCTQCGDSLCDRCGADWDQADRYHELARALGAVGDIAALTPPDPPAQEGAEPVESDRQATGQAESVA